MIACKHCGRPITQHGRFARCSSGETQYEPTPAAEPDPQRDGELPWTRADEDRMSAIADYAEGSIRGDA